MATPLPATTVWTPLWPSRPPYAIGDADPDSPSVRAFAPTVKSVGGAVVVCPGGGYGVLAPHEGEAICRWLSGLGMAAIELRYRLAPRYRHPSMIIDARRAVRWVRFHAEALGIDPGKIGIMGFSAGGHLAATASTLFDRRFDGETADAIDAVSARPDATVLCYPVITAAASYAHGGSVLNLLGENPDSGLKDLLSPEKQATPRTPPAFIFHTADDPAVPMANAVAYASALHDKGVPVELHVYETGRHGVGLAEGEPALRSWTTLCADWLRRRGLAQ